MISPPSSRNRTAAALTALVASVSLAGAEVQVGEHTFTLPEGFEIELVAGPPLVERPMMADFDEQGRLYVADSSGSNDPVEQQLEDKPHRIVRLEDSDGDGRFDRSVVFADRMMFPEGVLYHGGAVYSGAPPSIWRLRDTDDDGVADERMEWHQGNTLTGCANDLHGPYLGPDGWIYWCKGAFAEQTYERPGRRTIADRAAHIFRSRPDGSEFDSVMSGGMDNPVEAAFDDEGEVFFTTTFFHHPQAGKRDAVVHCIYGAVYPKVHGVLDNLQRTGDLLPPLVELGPAAACSLMRYESTVWGPEYRGDLFSTLFNLRKVMRHRVEPVGSTYRSDDEDFLVSDNRDFHPTDVLEDADGSLLVIDTGGWYKICCPTSQLAKPDVLGAIYRIRRTGALVPDDPRGLRLAWSTLRTEELARLLDDPRPSVRRRAVHQLGRSGEAAVPALTEVVQQAETPQRRQNAVWALTRIDSASARQAIRLALEDCDPRVQQTALHSAAMHRDGEALPQLLQFLASTNRFHQRKAAEALGRLGDPVAVPALLETAGRFRDPLAPSHRSPGAGGEIDAVERVQEHALIYALIEIAAPAATATGLTSANPDIRRAALVALDQMDGGNLSVREVAPLLAHSDSRLRETADWIASHHPDWGGDLAGYFRGRLNGEQAVLGEESLLIEQLARFAGTPAIQDLIARAAGDSQTPAATRFLALTAMAKADVKQAPTVWWSAITECLMGPEPLLDAALRAARSLPRDEQVPPALSAALLWVAHDTARSVPRRIEALRVLPSLPSPVEPELLALLLSNVSPSVAPSVRGGAVSVLRRAELSEDQWLALAKTLIEVGPMELNGLLDAFEKVSSEAVGQQLVVSLEASKSLSAARVDLLQKRLGQFSPEVQTAGRELLRRLDVDPVAQGERLESLAMEMQELAGDVRRGQEVFNSAQTACATCHAMGYVGGRVGPDLTTIGQIRSERDLLEAIAYPDASFVRSFEPVRVFTLDDEDYSGILRNETDERIELVTGADTTVRLVKTEISEMRPGSVSLMPGGMADQLSRQELADLLAFLGAR